jgi:lipopolysaccharide export system protein LptA
VNSRLLALRRVSLVLLLIWVAILVGSFGRRRLQQQPQTGPVDVGSTTEEGQEPPIRVHKGFVYSDTLGIEPNFRISAPEAVEFASGWYEFRDVQVSLYHQGQVAYGLQADRLRFDPAKHEAQTLGRAAVSLKGGVTLQAASFTLGGPDRLLRSNGPVTFAGPGWGGLAGGTRSSLQDDTMELIDSVSVTWHQTSADSVPALSLLTPHLVYHRKRALIQFPEGLTLLRGKLQAKAPKAEMQLSGAEGDLRKLLLEGTVHVDGTLDDGSDIRATAGRTTLEAVAGGRYAMTAEPAAGTGWVDVSWADAGAGMREFAAWRLVGEGTRAAWEWLEGQGQTCASELRKDEDPRSVLAARMRLLFDAGRARTVRASESVRVETGKEWAEGGELEFSLRSKTFTLLPTQGKRVLLGAPDATTWCDRLQGDDGGTISASGQVIGLIERSGASGQGKDPLRFAGGTATSSEGGARIALDGDARLWQGDRLVRADHLDYEREHEVVTGQGSVLTTARGVSKAGPGNEVQVRSRHLRYDRIAGVATYEGDVTLEDPQAQASCQRLVATTDERGNLVQANLDGGVTVRDRTTGRVITGQRAQMQVDQGFFEVWGSPVLVKEAAGNQVKADHLKWLRATNTVVVLGAEDNPSETLYHPARPVPTLRPKEKKP